MKLFTGLMAALILPLTLPAQEIRFSSDLHREGEKVTIYREWPSRKLVDTLRLTGKTFTYTLPGKEAAVYSVHLRKPFVDAVLLEDGAPVNIRVTKDTLVLVNGGSSQKKWNEIISRLKPDEEAWRDWGNRYEKATDLETKLKANAGSNRYAAKVQQERLSFALKNAGNLAGAWMAYSYGFAWSAADLDRLLPVFSQQKHAAATYALLQDKSRELAAFNMTGKKAPAFSLASIDGHTATLESLIGDNRYLLLDVWASWCTPCRATNRKLAPLYEKLHGKGIGFVSVSVDEKRELWEKAVAADKIPWTQLISQDGMKGEFVKQYKVQFLPATFLIDRNGTIVKQHIEIEDLEKL